MYAAATPSPIYWLTGSVVVMAVVMMMQAHIASPMVIHAPLVPTLALHSYTHCRHLV